MTKNKEASNAFDVHFSVSVPKHSPAFLWLNKQHIGVEKVKSIEDWNNYDTKSLEKATHIAHMGRLGLLECELQKNGDFVALYLALNGVRYRLVPDDGVSD